MNTVDTHIRPYTLLKDAIVFCVTIFVCTFVMTAAHTLNKTATILSAPMPELAIPQPPAALAPLPETLTVVAEGGAVAAAPEEADAPVAALDGGIPAETDMTAAIASASNETETLPAEVVPFHGIIVQAAGRYAVDPHLIRAIIFAESGYNPKAKSKKGARGLMQLMPSTAKALGVQDVYDPKENIDGGVRYFRSLLDRFDGDVQLALAAYNAGSRHVRNYEGIPPFKATRHYIKKVLKFQEKFKMQNRPDSRRLA